MFTINRVLFPRLTGVFTGPRFGMLGVTALCLWLTACALGPDYRPPQPTLPQRWTEQPATTAVDPRPDLSEWWRGFRDSRLNRLIERAMQGNLDLQQARARIQAARAQQNVVDAERWPSVSAFSGYQRQRISPNALLGALGTIQNNGNQAAQSASLLSTLGTPFNLFQAGFDSAWELDLFGGIRRQQEAAEANADAIEASRHDI